MVFLMLTARKLCDIYFAKNNSIEYIREKSEKIIEILKELGAENITSKSIQTTLKVKKKG